MSIDCHKYYYHVILALIYILPTCEASYCCLIVTFHYQLTDSCIPLHERHRCVLPAAVSSNFAVADRYKFRTRQVSETMSFRCIGISNAAYMAIIVMYRLFFIFATSYCTFTQKVSHFMGLRLPWLDLPPWENSCTSEFKDF